MSDPHAPLAALPEPSLRETMHPLVRLAMREGAVEPSVLRELMVLQREWEADNARREFTAALVALKAALPPAIERDVTVDFTSSKGHVHYTHTSLAAAMEAVTAPLAAHGFSLAWVPASEGGKVRVTCRLTHVGGHHLETTLEAPVDTSGSKSPAQGVASTITLLERYSALALLGIATKDMRDPTPDAGDHIDTARNIRAVGRLTKHGRTREQAEEFLGKPLLQWTTEDLSRLTEWVRGSMGGTSTG